MGIKYLCPFWGSSSLSAKEFVNKALEAGGAIDTAVESGQASVAFREYGDHLPKRGIKALVCVLRRS